MTSQNYIVAGGFRIELTEDEMTAVFDAVNESTNLGTDMESAYRKMYEAHKVLGEAYNRRNYAGTKG